MPEYLYRKRPPGIGCQPDGWIEREAWHPPREHPSGNEGQHFWGIIEYPEKLPISEIIRWDFWPVDATERAEMVFRDDDWLRENYLSQPVDKLREYAAKGDQKAAAALVLKGEVGSQ